MITICCGAYPLNSRWPKKYFKNFNSYFFPPSWTRLVQSTLMETTRAHPVKYNQTIKDRLQALLAGWFVWHDIEDIKCTYNQA